MNQSYSFPRDHFRLVVILFLFAPQPRNLGSCFPRGLIFVIINIIWPTKLVMNRIDLFDGHADPCISSRKRMVATRERCCFDRVEISEFGCDGDYLLHRRRALKKSSVEIPERHIHQSPTL